MLAMKRKIVCPHQHRRARRCVFGREIQVLSGRFSELCGTVIRGVNYGWEVFTWLAGIWHAKLITPKLTNTNASTRLIFAKSCLRSFCSESFCFGKIKEENCCVSVRSDTLSLLVASRRHTYTPEGKQFTFAPTQTRGKLQQVWQKGF